MIGNVIPGVHYQIYCAGSPKCIDSLTHQCRPVICCTLVWCLATWEL